MSNKTTLPCSFDFSEEDDNILICKHSQDHKVILLPGTKVDTLLSMLRGGFLTGKAKLEAEAIKEAKAHSSAYFL